MRKYIVLMQDNRLMPETHFSFHYVSPMEVGNMVPANPIGAGVPLSRAFEDLKMANFVKLEPQPFTLDEIDVNNVASISFMHYDAIGLFKYAIVFDAFSDKRG